LGLVKLTEYELSVKYALSKGCSYLNLERPHSQAFNGSQYESY